MGHKKRNLVVPRSKHPPSPAAAEAGPPSSPEEAETPPNLTNNHNGTTVNGDNVSSSVNSPQSKEVSTAELDGQGYAAIKQECERALTSLRRGNHTKALRLMKEAFSRHGGDKRLPPYSAALIHRVQGTVCVKAASVMDDQNAKQRYLKTAVESARKAAELSPNSVEFAHFYANLVYETASEGKDYEEVMRECERALQIESPVDPGKESLQDEKELKIGSPEGRVAHVQGELHNLKQKASISSLSSWMKTLGTGDEIRLIPIRRAAEDPMELRLVQTARRPNEIKKATKTPEERRKEIEVRVAAARLMQQQQQQQKAEGGNEGEKTDKGRGGGGGGGGGGEMASGERRAERKKYGSNRRNASNLERKDRVRAFWNSMSLGMKRELLRIKVSDLRGYFGLSSSKDGLASEVLNEALGFAEENKTWRFWACCRCSEKFVDPETHVQHVVQEHVGNVMPKMQLVMPQGLDNDWIEMILNCSWKPLDVSSAVKMLGSGRGKCQDSNLVDEFCSGDHNDDCDDCFKDAWDSSPEKETFRVDRDECIEGNGHIDRVSGECKKCDENQAHVLYSIDSWPISEDSERGKLLERIHGLLEALIRHKYLAKSHLNKVIQFTVEELQTLASGSHLLNHGVDQTPICICFLGATQLRKIRDFLQELPNSCSLGRYSDKSGVIDDASFGKQFDEIREKVVLNGDASWLYLDEHLLPLDSTSGASPTDDAGTITSTVVGNGNGIAADTDTLLSWIFAGPSSGDQLQSWMRKKEEKMQQGVDIVQVLNKEFYNLQNLCEKKCNHLNYEEALQAVEDLCLEEGKKRENGHGGYDALLRKRKDELENDPSFISNKTESDVISNILRDAGDLSVNQFGYEETCGGVSSQLCDLESGEDDVWRTKDYWHQADTCIEVAIQRQKEQLSVELSKDDARIMRSVTEMHQLEVKLDPVSANDYQLILVPLVKSYMRAHLEDLAEKDATEKSDAAWEAFLAELALDSKKGIRGGNDNLRSLQEKAKDKKKNKESKRAKDSKTHAANEHHLASDETDEQISPHTVPDCDHLDSDVLHSVDGDALKLHEEEFRLKVELEAEERKLEETLEYQRRIENEAKLKHLAEQQHKVSDTVLPQNVYGEAQDVFFDSTADEVQEPLVQKNGFLNHPEVMRVASENGAGQKSIVSGAELVNGTPSEKENKGLPNGGITENGHLSSDRRSGRRGRRQRSSARSFDGKNKLPEKENIEFGSVNLNIGESISKTLGELKVEEDDEERFQADLKKAVRQSLDTFQAQQRMPLVPNSRSPQKNSQEVGNVGVLLNDISTNNADGSDVYGSGLRNDVGEYNCFLNVIIQSLWHLRLFRDEFLKRSTSEHVHIGDPCVVCALYNIFTALSIASTDTRRDAVAPTSLRIALSNLYPDSNFFQEAQMNDASEVLAVIFDCLHKAFTSGSSVSDSESMERNCMGSWDCTNIACTVHSFFGMHIFERMNCYSCSLESRHMKYTSFFHNINASALRTMKVMCAESTFDELLNLVEMNHQLACDPDSGGCGKPNYIHHILSGPPRVFTTVLGWQNTCESADDIASTLAALSTEIDISVLYRGLDPKHKYNLVSVVCYYGQHYHCFAFSHELERWFMYDDKTVKVIGSWTDVLTMCEKGHLQPQVLFFEAVK